VIASLACRLLDFVIPRSCAGCDSPVNGDAVWCEPCSEAVVPLKRNIEEYTPQGHRVLAPFSYEGPVAKAIHRLKFSNRPELAHSLGQRLATEVVLARIPSGATIVPVPTTPERIVERGYNQSALLASAMSRKSGIRLIPTALRRNHSAPHQVGADKAQRARQVAGAFTADSGIIANAKVILVDDVVTTGATSAACAKAIEAAGGQLIAVVAVARVL
jgi:ComF family protein